jgi:AraC family transcriptional regulator, regulatory protein of adaptative response / methylphosphotriester-DNA alkyltransferase methyltransferase
MVLTENEKWEAVVKCDKSYDGQFFYGVKTTGIFCKPSCRSKTPLRGNCEFFSEIDKAYHRGLRPCKRCRPDLLDYNPANELLEKVKSVYDICFDDSANLVLEIKKLNISQNHLIRIFYAKFGKTPIEYINKMRIDKAKQLLLKNNDNILNIALLCGFGSISTFYECFKKQVGLTPNIYRKTYILIEHVI